MKNFCRKELLKHNKSGAEWYHRAASCKKSIRKNKSISKNKLTRKNIFRYKMCFLVDLFFLIELFFLIDFLHEAALDTFFILSMYLYFLHNIRANAWKNGYNGIQLVLVLGLVFRNLLVSVGTVSKLHFWVRSLIH